MIEIIGYYEDKEEVYEEPSHPWHFIVDAWKYYDCFKVIQNRRVVAVCGEKAKWREEYLSREEVIEKRDSEEIY